MAVVAQAQDSNKPEKELYQSYFGNDSTNLNIYYVPCYSADYFIVLTGVIYTSDTITINGKQYYYSEPQSLECIIQPTFHFLFPRLDTLFLREERETGRLYRYYRNYFEMGETEKLISDMSLEVGDKFIYPNYFDCLLEDTITVSNVFYNNGIKTIEFWTDQTYITFKEGRFSSMFPLWQEPLFDDILWSESARRIELLCEYKDGHQVFGFNNECFPDPSNIEQIDGYKMSLYPNIIKNSANITIEARENIKDILITDIFGKTYEIDKKTTDNNIWQISICDNLAKGVYVVLIVTDNSIYYEKVLVVD